MVEMSAAAAFSIGRRAESDIRHGQSEDEVKAEIRLACQPHVESEQDLDKVTEEIYKSALSNVTKNFLP